MSSEESRSQGPPESLIAEILEAENLGESVDRNAIIEEHPDLADSLRDFYANHDKMKSVADQEDPTLPPNASGLDDATIPPNPSNEQEATMSPRVDGDDPTIPPTKTSSTGGAAVGDQVRYFGDYELLEEIARGGMGVVFKARQINLNRIVALKMIFAGQFAGEEDVQRFYTEAEAAAQLDHPGIVPIFEIGEHQGQHYFSMGYVEGESLAQKVADGPLPPREAAELVRKICEAMAYAHERGVIHRDLKPANILIDRNGQPKVTDFGLAKRTEADSNLTGTGQILGTPAYMPPEQASGKTDVGPLADVYSLGAILYCLLTGRPPFQAASPMDTLLQVLDQEPASPRALNGIVPQDVDTICLKCLNKESRRRYAGAELMAAELSRFLRGEPILARPVGRVERCWRWCKRNPAVATATAAAVLFLVTGSILSTYFGMDAQNKAASALEAQGLAEVSAAQARASETKAKTSEAKATRLAEKEATASKNWQQAAKRAEALRITSEIQRASDESPVRALSLIAELGDAITKNGLRPPRETRQLLRDLLGNALGYPIVPTSHHVALQEAYEQRFPADKYVRLGGADAIGIDFRGGLSFSPSGEWMMFRTLRHGMGIVNLSQDDPGAR